jgi:hypothetical protein
MYGSTSTSTSSAPSSKRTLRHHAVGSISTANRSLLSTQGKLQPTIGGHLVVAANSINAPAFVLCLLASLCPPLALLLGWLGSTCLRPGVSIAARNVRAGMVAELDGRACEVVRVRLVGTTRVELVYVVRGTAKGRARTVLESGAVEMRAEEPIRVITDPYAATCSSMRSARLACGPSLHSIRSIFARGRFLEFAAWRYLISIGLTLSWACIVFQLAFHVQHPLLSEIPSKAGYFVVAEYPIFVQCFLVLLIAGLCANASKSSSHYELVKRAHKRSFFGSAATTPRSTPRGTGSTSTSGVMYSTMKSRLRRWKRGRTGRPMFLGWHEFALITTVALLRAVLTVAWSDDARWTGVDLLGGPVPFRAWSSQFPGVPLPHESLPLVPPSGTASGTAKTVALSAILSGATHAVHGAPRSWATDALKHIPTSRVVVNLTALLLPIIQSVLGVAILFQLVNDWRYHQERWDAFGQMCEVGSAGESVAAGVATAMSEVRTNEVIHETEIEMGRDIDGDGIVGHAGGGGGGGDAACDAGTTTSSTTSAAASHPSGEFEAESLLPADASGVRIRGGGDIGLGDVDVGEGEDKYRHALLRLNTHDNLMAWLKIRSYLRDVKGLRTLELLRTCTLVLLPPLAWCTVDLLIASLRNPSHAAARILAWRIDRTFDFFIVWLVIIRIFQVGTSISERLAAHKNVVSGERMAVLYQQCSLEDEVATQALDKEMLAAVKAQMGRNKKLDDLLKQTGDWLKALSHHPNEQPKVLGVTLSTKWAQRISALFVTYGMFLVGEVARRIDID